MIITPHRPAWPFRLNNNSEQTENLIFWTPFPAGLARGYNVLDFARRWPGVFSSSLDWASDPGTSAGGNAEMIAPPQFGLTPKWNGSGQKCNFAGLHLPSPITISVWANFNSYNTAVSQFICGEWENAGNTWLLYFWGAGVSPARISLNAGSDNWMNFPSAAGLWVNIVFDSAAAQGYINGFAQSMTGSVQTWSSTSNDFQIGAWTSGQLDARIGDLRIYSGSLSATRIRQLYDPHTRWELYQPIGKRTSVKRGVTNETISPAGSLTPAGALVRQPAFYPAGTLTPLGSFTTTTPRTRLYFSSTLPANVSPAYNGGWTHITQASRWRLNNVKAASAMADGTRIAWTSSGAEIALDRQYVSNILNGAQSVGGIVKMQLLCREFQNSDNVNEVYLTVYVVSGDGSTVRGEILPLDEYSAVTELLHNGYRNKTFVVNHGGVVAAQDGDRIVVEFGYSAATVTTTPEARGRFGENAADLAENETDTADGAGWIEMAGTLAFIAIGSNEIAPAGSATPTGAVRKTVGKIL